jgi:3-(3-hydroxy-phenyl)propionate hydroxylase
MTDFDVLISGYGPTGAVAANLLGQRGVRTLVATLRRGTERFGSVEVRLGSGLEHFEQDDERVRVRIRRAADGASEEVTTRYLLGCDGASSPTREIAGLGLDDLHCDEPWLVCDVLLPEGMEYRRTAYQVCDYRRPTTIVPCENRHIRWEFMLRPGDDPAQLEREQNVRAMMAPHLHRLNPALGPDQGELLRGKVYTFHALVARRWRDRRVFVLGDAAHQTPPFLGQGLCAGIRDAFNLCWKLDGVLDGRFHPGLLDSYESEREPHARAVVEKAVRIGRVIQTTSPPRAWLRDASFRLARRFPPLLRPFLWEPSWPLGPGLFGARQRPGPGTAHGHPIDQVFVETGAGRRARLDDLYGNEFALIVRDAEPGGVIDEDTAKALAEIRTRCLRVVPKDASDPGPEAIVDVEGGIREWFDRFGGGRAALLRPDRQVFGIYGRDARGDLGAELRSAASVLNARLAGAPEPRA